MELLLLDTALNLESITYYCCCFVGNNLATGSAQKFKSALLTHQRKAKECNQIKPFDIKALLDSSNFSFPL